MTWDEVRAEYPQRGTPSTYDGVWLSSPAIDVAEQHRIGRHRGLQPVILRLQFASYLTILPGSWKEVGRDLG